MIMANWLMAGFLAKNNQPAIFRSQPPPRERLFRNNEGSLFQNWMQRKHLSRFMLGKEPQHHSGLGLDAYVTATSPIRKYFDLVTQRQVRAVLGFDQPYTQEDILNTINAVEQPISTVSRIQYNRNRYWLLKYLEQKAGEKTEAVVLSKLRDGYSILLKEYMLECRLPMSKGIALKPQDLVQVTLQHANARNDMVSVYIG
jgi:exoribonuclease-2